MGKNIVEKILSRHIVEGDLLKESKIAIKIDRTLTQDSTGTMAYLQLEAMGIDRVKTKKSLAYIDHNMLQQGFENADDHKFIQTIANKYGIYFSRPGNGICHQVNLERFSVPGDTLLGSDSHTPTAGGVGMLAIGAGGLDVALAMAGEPYYIKVPKVVKVELKGRLSPMISSKDIVLELLKRESVKGGVGKIYEYSGEGVKYLSVPQRATITNMGAELGATTSIFPSDERTKEFFKAQDRLEDWLELKADLDANYDSVIEIDLEKLDAMVAAPHSPDNVRTCREEGRVKLDQVAIGSCTNSSYEDLMKVARILKGKKVAAHTSLVIAPGSRQVMEMLAKNGALADIISSGARILENSCGPCIGMGQSPGTDAVSLRTFNRNFYGRSGTNSARVYLASPEVAAVSAIYGYLTDPRDADFEIDFENISVDKFIIDDSMIIAPASEGQEVEVVRGPNIKPFPLNTKLKNSIFAKVIIKTEDNITTDHIMPSNAKLLPYRSNIPYLSEFCFSTIDQEFARRAKDNKVGIIVAGENYGQGSSREHAALAPLYLGIRAVLAKSFARIHKANLINSGILALEFENAEDYKRIDQMDQLELVEIFDGLENARIKAINRDKNFEFYLRASFSREEVLILLAGGKLNSIKQKASLVEELCIR